jgi:hypothetical protein
MFELKKDIPMPVCPSYPWETMEIGDCLVFESEADFKAAAKSARAQASAIFLCKDQKIWLAHIKRAHKDGPNDKLLRLLARKDGLTEGVIINRMRNFPKKDVLQSLEDLVASGSVIATETMHRFKGLKVFRYKKAA